MKELTRHETTQVFGANLELVYVAGPTLVIALKGFKLCYELGIPYFTPLPLIGTVMVSSLAGATIGYFANKDYVLGSIVGSMSGMFAAYYFGINHLS